MEGGFGHDFGAVRVHDDATADRAARSLGAQAFTVGNDVIFSAGRYSPSTTGGRWLLAHELTHVVQQSRAAHAMDTVVGAHEAQEAEASHAAELVVAGRHAPVRLRSDRGAVMCRREASPLQEALDELSASVELSTRGSYAQNDAAKLVAQAQKLNAALEAGSSPRVELAYAESLVLIHSLLVGQLAAAPVDDKGVPRLDGLPPGTRDVDSVPPFSEIGRWQAIVGTALVAQSVPALPERPRRSERPRGPASPLPAPPAAGIVVSENFEAHGNGEPLTDGAEIEQAIAAAGRVRVGDLHLALSKAAAGPGNDQLSPERLTRAGRELSGLAADDSASLASQVGHIVYIATRIYVLGPSGAIAGEDFAFDIGGQSLRPGVYFAFPGPVVRGHRAVAKIDGPLAVGYQGDFRATFPLDSLFVVADRMVAQLEPDFAKGRGFLIVVAPAVFGGLAVRPFANFGNLVSAVWRSKNYVLDEMSRVWSEMKKEPDQATLDLGVQMGLDKIGKMLPKVGTVMKQAMLVLLADSLGPLAAIALYARTNDEVELAAHGIARWVAEQVVQQLLITGIHLTVARTKLVVQKSLGRGGTPLALEGAKTTVKVPPPRPHLDAEQGAELLTAGGWKKYIAALGTESAEAKHIEAQRDGLVDWLRERLGATDDEIIRTGTRQAYSDLDVNFYGPKAVERLYQARQLLQERFGWHTDALDLMFDMSLLVDSARAHLYTDKRLSRASRLRLQRHLESGARMRYLEALATRARGSTLARAELERAAREWGIDPEKVKAKAPFSPHEFQEHFEAIEEMNTAYRENPSEDLAKHIVDAQIELNVRSEGAYYEPASIRERASRETGRAGGRLTLGEVFAEMLNERVEFFARIAKAERALAGIDAGLSAARTAAERLKVLSAAALQYQLSKYAWRFLELAERAGLPIDPELKATANRIKTTKSVDGILLGPNELAGYVGALDHIQTEILSLMDTRLQSLDRSRADLVIDIRQRVWPLVTALETTSDFLRAHSTEIDGILVHNAARVIVVRGREDRRPGIDESPPAADGEIQRKAATSGVAPEEADHRQPVVAAALDAPGQALDTGTRELMESTIGHDFSRVRIHADATAAASAGAVDALAYTVGPHVVFGAGRYAPGTAEGRHLLAHELTHVWQQSPSSALPASGVAGVGGGLQAKRGDGPATPAERAADAVADHVVKRPDAKPAEGDSTQAVPGRLVPLAEPQKTRKILADDLFVPWGLRYALAAKPLDGLEVPDEGTLEQQQRRDEAARRVARRVHDAFANPPVLEDGRKYTPSQLAQVAPDAVKLLTSQHGDDRRAVLRQFRSLYGLTLRAYAIANLFPGAGRIEARKNLVRVLGYLELGHVTDPVVAMGLALIPLGTRDEAIVGILRRVPVGQRRAFARRYAETFSGIGLTDNDMLEEHLRDDLSEDWNGWRLQQALAVLDHNLHPAEEVYFNAKDGRSGDVVKQVQETWRQGSGAFKKLESDWNFYVRNGGLWTRDAWTDLDLGTALLRELGENSQAWRLISPVIFASLDAAMAKDSYDIAQIDAATKSKAAGYPAAAVLPENVLAENAPLPTDLEDAVHLESLEASLKAASGILFTGSDTAQVESILGDIAKIWANRSQRARARGDMAAQIRADTEYDQVNARLSERLGSYTSAGGAIPLWTVDAEKARLALLVDRRPADDVYGHKLVGDWQKCVEDVTTIWAAGQIDRYRSDAGTPSRRRFHRPTCVRS